MLDNSLARSLQTDDGLYYHMLMLEGGQHEKFDAALENALETENPLSDLVLALATSGGDMNRQLSYIKEHLSQTDISAIDSNRVFDHVIADLRELYEAKEMPINRLTWLMYSVAWNSGWCQKKLWQSLYYMDDYYNLLYYGVLRQEEFDKTIKALLYDRQEINPMTRFSVQDR